ALDPTHPDERLNAIIRDAQVRLAVTNSGFADRLARYGLELICLDSLLVGFDPDGLNNVPSGARPDNVAYVTYTSGSTGEPKGVVATHRSITNGLHAVPFDRGAPDEVCCLNTPLSFGFSVSRFFLPLVC